MDWEQLSAEPAELGEGPCWHREEQVLYWVDIYGHSLHCLDPQTKESRSWNLGQRIGTVSPRDGGGLVVALESAIGFFDPQSGQTEILDTIESHPETRFNDGKCDPQGRFWVGSMDNVRESRPLGTLYRIDPDGSVHRMVDGVTISNGLAWSPDGGTMYYIDTPTRQIVAFDFDVKSGTISKQRTAVAVGAEHGYPDGMTIDSEGKLWVAHWGGQRVCRWDPVTGQLLEHFLTPAPNTTCCCFGGPELTDLYITTASKGLTKRQRTEYPQSGHLFRSPTPFSGAPAHAYQG